MDKRVYNLLSLIEDNNKEAYIVGGYVRDYLLNIDSHDYDICTNCSIEELCSIIGNKYSYIIKLGTIFLNIDGINIEITPYRKELEYKKRKPSKYIPAKTLLEDLMRRDFTINTICMNKDGDIIDLLNGQNDLTKGIIKNVGDIDKKLTEDPLRILRALRFSAKYNFKLESNLKLAILKHSQLLNTLSIMRKREEIDKLIDIHKLEILKEYNIDTYLDIDLNNIKYYNSKLLTWLMIDPKDIYVNNNKEKKIINKVRYLREHINDYNLYLYGYLLSQKSPTFHHATIPKPQHYLTDRVQTFCSIDYLKDIQHAHYQILANQKHHATSLLKFHADVFQPLVLRPARHYPPINLPVLFLFQNEVQMSPIQSLAELLNH